MHVQDSKIMSVVIDEAVTEALETDNLALQNMSSSKYVQACPCLLPHELAGHLAPAQPAAVAA